MGWELSASEVVKTLTHLVLKEETTNEKLKKKKN